MLEGLETVEHRKQAEIHRAHVERGDLGLEDCGRLNALLHGHEGRAAGRQIDHRLGRLLDARQEARKGLRTLIRAPGALVARVQMNDCGAGLGGADRRLGDLVRRHRQVRRHRRRMDGAGDGTGDDDLVARSHGVRPSLSLFSLQRPMSLSARRLWAASAISRRSRQDCRSLSLSAGKRARRSASILSSTGPLQSTRHCVEGKMPE